MIVAWFAAAIVLGIVEVLSVDLFFLTLALAALGGGVTAVLGFPLWVQLVVFVVASLLLLLFIRPWAKRQLERSTPRIDTNARRLVGMTALVTAALQGTEGRVLLDGGEWSARGQGGRQFPVGTRVRVVEIDGAPAVVGPEDEYVPVPGDSQPPEDPRI